MNMKKQLKMLLILLIMASSIFNFANRTLFTTVNATYVEGPITQDTIWTLVDSPFVVSKNVTVYSSATLTIEPGVDVRFGENFWLVVNGRVIANGVEDKLIRFTSNKLTPMKGDWGTFLINGTQPSSLIHCIIEYGTNGIMIEDGSLNIQYSFVRSNSENGIKINNGTIVVKNNKILNNTMSGIRITDGSQITIQNNTISSNGDGILLAGHLTGEIDIEQNNILLNGQSGIALEADAYDNTVIINNNVSTNFNGFRVSTNTSTYITRNYVSNNTVGIYYESGINHEAHFNDIYDNDLGMDASPTATVDATYNYWGHRSGPLHESLNPHGKGNPVGGNGVNLDFIFFLSQPIDYNNAHPTAVLWADKILVAPNQNVMFIGANSHDDGRVDQYFFDFGDETNSGWVTLSLFNHSYSSNGTYIASLRVIDDFNVTSDSTLTTISVQDLTSLEASVTLNTYTVNSNEEVSVSVYVSDGISAVENANVTLFSVKGGIFKPQSGLTNSTGHFTATFIAPNVTELTNVRIIARVSKTGYADGSDYKYLKVLPLLKVQVTTESTTIKSEETATVTVYVTGGFEEPVADASLVFTVDYGSLSATAGVTDLNGMAVINFTAPQTLSQMNVTIAATAMKMEYAEGHDQKIITVEPKILAVEVTATPTIIVSEATSTITAQVIFDGIPLSNVIVTVSSDNGGNFSTLTEITNSNGDAVFVFIAPQTTMMDGLNATITAIATKSGYVSGEAQAIVFIKPKVLVVQVTAKPDATTSEGKINATVHVAYGELPVQEANVTITSENFPTTTGLTDIYGNATFVLTAPQVNAPLNVTIIARASKIGYVDGENQLNVTINPGILDVTVTAKPSTVASGESALVTVHVTCNTIPVANASITLSSSQGNLSATTGLTNSNGYCTFIFNASRTTEQIPQIIIIANATKNGYISAENQTTITVTAEAGEGGLPLTTILLIIIPIIIAAVVVILIKLKIIVLSTGEEE
jgi:parallel beta-helix repeat protein